MKANSNGVRRRDLFRVGTASTAVAGVAALTGAKPAQAAAPALVGSAIGASSLPIPMLQMVACEPKPVVVSYTPTLTSVDTGRVTEYTDVDPANLKVTFVCPPSGQVRFKLSACAVVAAGSATRWLLRHNGKNVPGTETNVAYNATATESGATNYTVRGVMKLDGDGKPLVPGRQYTVTWGQRCSVSGKWGKTQYGGSCGAATLTIEPVVHRATESSYSWGTTQPGWVPLWLCKDGKTVLGIPGVGSRLAWSMDDGATWTNHSASLPVSVQGVRDMANGELVVFTEAISVSQPAAIWVSSGWPVDKATAKFTKVREATGGPELKAWREFCVDTYGSIVLAAEYGPKVSPTNMAKAVHMSEDYGQTWKIIFDLSAPDKSTGVGAHLHGVCYDPWWDAIWVTCGDGPGNRGVWVSFDRGDSWRKTSLDHQCTSIIALPGCVLMFTDQGGPNGIWRFPRTHPDSLVPEMAFVQDPQQPLTVYGTQPYQRRGLPGAPVLFPVQTDLTGPARLFATYDGYTFKEMWTDSQTYASRGLMTAMGPTESGKYLGRLNRIDYFAGHAEMLTLNPPT